MKRNALFIFCFFMAACGHAFAQTGRDDLAQQLNEAILGAKKFDEEKEANIRRVRNSLHDPARSSLHSQYAFYRNLYEEYKIFRFDSAFINANKLTEIAVSLHDPAKLAQANINLLFAFVSAGMFKEAAEVVNEIDVHDQPDSMKAAYYALKARYYYDLADYVSDQFHTPVYYQSGNVNLDSALAYYPAASFEAVYYNGLKNLKRGDLDKAEADFQTLLGRNNLGYHQQALVSSTLSNIFLQRGKRKTAIEYQMRAAIADIKSSTKETFAIYNLAQLLFENGDFETASSYIEKAIDDAAFYGARQRKVQVSAILPIIQSSRINFIEGQRRSWIIYGAAVSFVLILVSFLGFTIYRQNRKLEQARKAVSDALHNLSVLNDKLSAANARLQQVNAELNEANSKLVEANKIKEEYVGYFFNITSAFIHKMERLKANLEQKIESRKIEEIKFVAAKIDIKAEKEDLLKSFDKAFLRIFPHFVEEFNALLRDEEKITLQNTELLNTDLRIYALLRLGIKENEKIADILEYSIKSIYAYKTKIRNKASISKDEFDKRVMEIKSI